VPVALPTRGGGARLLVVLFAASGGLVIESVAAQVGLDASRADLVHAYAEQTDVPGGARCRGSGLMSSVCPSALDVVGLPERA
jgi:hypothetical protein